MLEVWCFHLWILCPINTALIIKFDYVIKYLYNNDIDKRLLATPRLKNILLNVFHNIQKVTKNIFM